MVERFVRDEEAVGSNPVTSTMQDCPFTASKRAVFLTERKVRLCRIFVWREQEVCSR